MNKYMKIAFEEAKISNNLDEVPVGAVIVKDGTIISKGHNTSFKDGVANHAEINAINEAIKTTNDWRLLDCDMYITLEPCPMCAGAILKSRIKKVYIGTKSNVESNQKLIESIFNNKDYYHYVDFEYLYDRSCSKILTDFFKKKRL